MTAWAVVAENSNSAVRGLVASAVEKESLVAEDSVKAVLVDSIVENDVLSAVKVSPILSVRIGHGQQKVTAGRKNPGMRRNLQRPVLVTTGIKTHKF
jgi:hypothetical protein